MTTKIILSVLIIGVLVQFSLTKPVDDPNDTSGNKIKKLEKVTISEQFDDEEISLTPKDQLLLFTLNGFQDISLLYVNKAQKISADIVKDPVLTNANTANVQEFKQNITKFNEKFDNCKDIDSLFDLVEFYSNTTSYYYEIPKEHLTADSTLILNLLRKYGSEKLDNEFEKLFNDFVENFNKKFEDIKKLFTKEELTNESVMIEWFNKFKTLTDFDEKITAFERFFTFYE